jgi:hypothetical protein
LTAAHDLGLGPGRPAGAARSAAWRTRGQRRSEGSGGRIDRHDRVRRTAIILFVLAFVFAGVAGAFGAFITKVAPVT